MSVDVGRAPSLRRRGELARVPAGEGFRLDIEGLRAITALLVAGFHVWGDKVSGGVDVFFVISGYFITMSLLGQVHRYGRIRPGRYLARLGQRLAPMALTVLAATIAVAWLLLPSGRRESELGHVIAALTSTENLNLAMLSVDYLAQDQPRALTQQFWAMSVQGQFYVLWLLIALAAAWIGARAPGGQRTGFAVLVAVAVGASFAWSITQTANDQAFAYFSPLTRVWEFGLGALIALVPMRFHLPMSLRVGMAWTGLAGIVTCAALVPVESAFPGWAALWPTLSAVLILSSGQKDAGLGANALLSHPALVRMGGFAFAIYLWHWPILLAVRSVLGHDHLGWRAGLAVIVLAVALAWATSRWIERPAIDAARAADRVRRRRANVLLIVAWVAIATTAGSLLLAVRASDAAQRSEVTSLLASADGACLGASAIEAGDPSCVDPVLEGRMLPEGTVGNDLQKPEAECAVKRWHSEARMCAYGEVGSDLRIGLVGNSHAISWFPALERIALAEGWELRVWYKQGCTFAIPQRAGTDPDFAEECERWVRNVRADLREGPALSWVATSAHQASRWLDERGEPSRAAADQAFEEAWAPFLDGGTSVVVLRDYPKSSDESVACVDRATVDAPAECARSRADVLDGGDEMWRAAVEGRIEGAYGVDLTSAFCDATTCWTAAGHVKVYRDHSHLTDTYATTLASPLYAALDTAGLIEVVTVGSS